MGKRIMNEFLRDFNVPDNKALYKKIHDEPEVAKAFNQLVDEGRKYNSQLRQQPALDNTVKTGEFIQEHNLWHSDKTMLLMMDSGFRFVGYKLYEPELEGAITTVNMLSDMLTTAYVNAAIIVHPTTTINQEHFYSEINRVDKQFKDLQNLAHGLNSSVVDCVIVDQFKCHSLLKSIGESDVSFKTPEVSAKINLPTMSPIPYKEGFQEFCEYYATEKIRGKNFWEDNTKIKNLLKLSYEFLPYEKAGILHLDKDANVLKMQSISSGTTNATTVYCDVICKELFKNNAKQWVLFHNHPSGIAEASRPDITLTTQFESITKALGKPLVEHFIIGDDVLAFSTSKELEGEVTKNAAISSINYQRSKELNL